MFPWAADSFDVGQDRAAMEAGQAAAARVRNAQPRSDPWHTSSEQVGKGLGWVPERERAMRTISTRLGGTAMSPPWDLDNPTGKWIKRASSPPFPPDRQRVSAVDVWRCCDVGVRSAWMCPRSPDPPESTLTRKRVAPPMNPYRHTPCSRTSSDRALEPSKAPSPKAL